ncbi:MAG: hypothetical protein DWI69_02965 [Chloroflexi bacterium]|nr:MAG: hypothetical protein DWI69_02965 [Chloroflexota bacterium]
MTTVQSAGIFARPLSLSVAPGLAWIPLVVLAAWYLWEVAGPDRLPQNLDLMLQYVPNAAHIARGLSQWHIPLWNPWQGGGMPFAADPGTGAWYVPNWPLLAGLNLWSAVRISIWSHLAIAIAGTWFCLRHSVRVGPVAAMAGTATFTLTPWLPGLAGMPVVLTSLAWMPWVVFAGLQLATQSRPSARLIGLLATSTALQLASGWPAGAYLSWLTIGGAVLLGHGRANDRLTHRLRRVIPGFAATGLLATAMSAVVLLPGAEFVAETTYVSTRPLERLATDGYLTLLSWLRPSSGVGAVEGGQVSVGIVALCLAMIAPAILWRTSHRDRLIIWGGLAVVSILLSWGTRTPLFGLLYTWLPGFRILYLPARLGIIGAFALSALAASVVDALDQPPSAGRDQPSLPPLIYTRFAITCGLLAVLPVMMTLQFWHSEGYDNFRRLLTNLWRITGTPFLSVGQEVHAFGFGLVVLAILTWNQRRHLPQAGVLLAIVVMADLGSLRLMTQSVSFDPDAWYAPAYATARTLSPRIGHDRYLGLVWHDDDLPRHFLGDFPDSARTGQLPPNLGLLTATRDAQGYNPLILRTAATAFAKVGNDDDHWLWANRFDPAGLIPLAVRAIVMSGQRSASGPRASLPASTSGEAGVGYENNAPSSNPPQATRDWRVTTVDLGQATADCCSEVPIWTATGSPVLTGHLEAITFLGEGTGVAQGQTAAEIRLTGPDGTTATYPLRAGIETAEWARDRPDVRTVVKHGQAPVALVTRMVSAVGGRFDTFEYRATIPVSLPGGITNATLRSTIPGVRVHLTHLAMHPPADREMWVREAWASEASINQAGLGSAAWGMSAVSPARPPATGDDSPWPASRLRVVPPDAGTANWVTDDPERLVISASLAANATIVIADSAYPGWRVSIDGTPGAGGFSRSAYEEQGNRSPDVPFGRLIPVPSGDHLIEMTFNPPSTRLGLTVSGVGVMVAAFLIAIRPSPIRRV